MAWYIWEKSIPCFNYLFWKFKTVAIVEYVPKQIDADKTKSSLN